jgi:hypothetical protein
MREVTRQLREAGSMRGGPDYRLNFPEFLERVLKRGRLRSTWRACAKASGSCAPTAGWSMAGTWRMRYGWRRCDACRNECSVTSGTILQGTLYPLETRLRVVW